MKLKCSGFLLPDIGGILNLVMRAFIFFSCAILFGMTPNDGFSQDAEIRIDETATITIQQVFQLIKSQTGYEMVYSNQNIRNAPKTKIIKGAIKVKDLLKKALEPINCYSRFTDNTIIIGKNRKRKTKVVLQETFSIKGIVKDEDGLPLFGASIYVFNNGNTKDFITRGTTSDFDGNFDIKVELNHILNVNMLGFKDFEMKILDKKEFYEITLQESSFELKEVVLTGYTKTVKKQSTVAASKITQKDIAKQKTINLDDRLVGLTPGLTLNNVNPNGGRSNLEIVIRGVSTFNQPEDQDFRKVAENSQNRQPLIVLDGFPYEGPFNDIDPNTIADIDILRDAAATALWGIRAANGVIVITTKRGTSNLKTTVTYGSNVTVGTKPDIDNLGIASAADVLPLLNGPGFVARGVISNTAEPRERFETISGYDEIWAQSLSGLITDAERDAKLLALSQNNVLGDFSKYLTRPGIVRENSLSINSGGTLMAYNFTATHAQEERQNVGDDFQRLSLNLTTNVNINEKLSATVDFGTVFSRTDDNGIGIGALLDQERNGIKLYDRLVDDNGVPRAIANVYSGNREEFNALGFDDASYNPILDQRLRDNETKRLNLRLAAGVNYKITDNLTADLKFQYNKINEEVNNNKKVDLFETRLANNTYVSRNGVISPTNPTIDRNDRIVPYGGTLENQLNTSTNTVIRGTLNYDRKLTEHHEINALAGMELTSNLFSFNRRTLFGYDDKTLLYDRFYNPPAPIFGNEAIQTSYFNPFGGTLILSTNDFQAEIEDRSISTFANLGYSYKQKYNLTFSGKIDQASAFGINKRLSRPILYAISGSWNIADEKFAKAEWLNQLKFRASYGVNGNLRNGLTTVVTIKNNTNDPVNNGNFASIDNPGNPNLSFEKTVTTNLGLDFSLWNYRLEATIDIYDRLSTDLLTPVDLNGTFGQTGFLSLSNSGSISNKGLEVSLNYDIIKSEKLQWNINLNFSYNKNKVLAYGLERATTNEELFLSVNRFNAREIVGHDISAQYRFQWAGLNRNGDPQVLNDNGDIVDASSENPPTSAALVITKPFNAPYFGGWRNTFTYKDVSLSFFMVYKFGHVFQENLRKKYARGEEEVLHKDVVNAWKNPGDENFTSIPRNEPAFSQKRFGYFTDSNYNIQDASFVRLRDVTLGYTLDSEVLSKIGFSNINFNLQARNLGLVWKATDLDIDPESVPFSGVNGSPSDNFAQAFRPGIKPTPSFVLGVQITF